MAASTRLVSAARNALSLLSSATGARPALLAAALVYVALCARLRFQRVRSLKQNKECASREAMSQMTNVQAQHIISDMARFEFPTMFKMSLQFALFKVNHNKRKEIMN